MTQISVTIEAMNPVNKANIDVILQKVTAIEGVLAARLTFDDQYKFRFVYDYDNSFDNDIIIREIKAMLNLYYSAVLSMKEDRSKAEI